ncbi:hypothetical protein ACCAA_770004 [Candidatus Accumulibacter aalborgensis]|uniref:Uncharacterized protein n=1 Tax=Candidatus Accumulibacter aalborgensis TaxID=1860102 RepID=A0A1A8XXS5_9PROT|nr:hypothetical protein ACCAA_770004 [Candidatus Accumulibacter aalborgensis]
MFSVKLTFLRKNLSRHCEPGAQQFAAGATALMGRSLSSNVGRTRGRPMNPPWTQQSTLQDVMPWLVEVSGLDPGAASSLESPVGSCAGLAGA